MRALFIRDVRRLALVAAAVIVGMLLFIAIGRLHGRDWNIEPEAVVAVGTVIGACLLGVATVAPDTDSGAVAFLARLPIPCSHALAAKLAAATFWLAALIAIPSIPFPYVPGRLWREDSYGLILAVAFASSVLASVMSRRTLPAVVLAPLVAGLSLLVFSWTAVLGLWMRNVMDDEKTLVVLGFSGAFLAIAFVAFGRGDRHRASWRPATMALGGLALVEVLSISGAALAHGWCIHDAPHWMSVYRMPALESPGGQKVALALGGRHWGGFEDRIAVVDRAAKTARLLPPRYTYAQSFSPDGKRLLAAGGEQPGGWLVDLETGSVERLEPAWEAATSGFGGELVLWRQGRPFFAGSVVGAIEVRAPGGGLLARCEVAHDVSLAGACGDRLALLSPGKLALLDPWTRRREEVAIDADLGERGVVVSPDSKRLVVAIAPTAGGTRLHVLDVTTGASRAFRYDMLFAQGIRESTFSPDRRRLAVTLTHEAAVVDLESGALERLERAQETGLSEPPFAVWSPDGARLALPWGVIHDFASGEERPCSHELVAFVTPGIGVAAGWGPLSFLDLATDKDVALPLEVGESEGRSPSRGGRGISPGGGDR